MPRQLATKSARAAACRPGAERDESLHLDESISIQLRMQAHAPAACLAMHRAQAHAHASVHAVAGVHACMHAGTCACRMLSHAPHARSARAHPPMRGDTTITSPAGAATAGSAKQSDLPPPVGMSTSESRPASAARTAASCAPRKAAWPLGGAEGRVRGGGAALAQRHLHRGCAERAFARVVPPRSPNTRCSVASTSSWLAACCAIAAAGSGPSAAGGRSDGRSTRCKRERPRSQPPRPRRCGLFWRAPAAGAHGLLQLPHGRPVPERAIRTIWAGLIGRSGFFEVTSAS